MASVGSIGGKLADDPPVVPPLPSELLDESLRGSSTCSNTGGDRSKSGSGTPRRDPPEPGTPPYAKWAKSFPFLLEDPEGQKLFQQYLHGEDVLNNLMFWYAVNGFKSQTDKDKKYRLAKVISRTFIRKDSPNSLGPEMASDNRKAILSAIKSNSIDNSLFERAQCEIEGFLEHKAYPAFLRSDVYIDYCNKAVAAAAAAASVKQDAGSPTSGSSTRNTIVGTAANLPTVHEDTELLCKEINLNGGNKGIEATPADFAPSPTSRNKHHHPPAPQCTSHTCMRSNKGSHVYTNFAPAHSTNDSEIQSLSSDTHTDDSLSLADSSLDISLPMGKRLQHMVKRDRKHIKYSAAQNGHHARMFPHMPHMARTAADRMGVVGSNQTKGQSDQQLSCEDFAAVLIEKLLVVQQEKEREDRNEQLHARLRGGARGTSSEYSMDQMCLDLNSTSVSDGALACRSSNSRVAGITYLSKTPTSGPELEDPESIIDKHVSRVFHDGYHSPVHTRSKTPDRFSTMHSNSTHRCTSCGQSTFSQTLPSNYRSANQPGHPCGGPVAAPSGRYPKPGPASTYANLEMGSRTMRYTMRKMADTSSSSKSTSSGVDSGVYDAQSLGSQDSYGGKNQMVSEWVEHSSRQQQHLVSKPAISLAATSSDRQQRTVGSRSAGSSRHRFASVSPAPLSSRQGLNACHHGGPALTVFNSSSAAQVQQRRSPVTTASVAGTGVAIQPQASIATATNPALSVTGAGSGATGGTNTPNSATAQTVVAYYFCNETIPYRTSVPFKSVTLGQFKGLLTRRGRFRYFFKMRSNEIEEGGVVHEEITDDNAVLPLFDGKIIGKIEKQ